MDWTRAAWDAKARDLSLLYEADTELAGWQLRQHRHFIEVPGATYNLVSLHTVIFGLRGGTMGEAFRSGQNLARLRPMLDKAGYDEASEGHPDFDTVWEDYLGLCHRARNTGPSGGKRSPPRQRSFFLRRDSVQSTDASAGRQRVFQERIADSLGGARSARLARLAVAPAVPVRTTSVVTTFARNPDVVAEALFRAKGVCQHCHTPAPFLHRRYRTPFLEVHHIVPLSDGGLDTVENVHALCPNCHRKAHYG